MSWTERHAAEWAAVLRSCSAWDAYKSVYGANVDPARVVGFLLLNDEFPRSLRFCAEELDAALRRISGVAGGRFANDAEQRSGRFLAELRFATVEDLLAEQGLHACLDRLQLRARRDRGGRRRGVREPDADGSRPRSRRSRSRCSSSRPGSASAS